MFCKMLRTCHNAACALHPHTQWVHAPSLPTSLTSDPAQTHTGALNAQHHSRCWQCLLSLSNQGSTHTTQEATCSLARRLQHTAAHQQWVPRKAAG